MQVAGELDWYGWRVNCETCGESRGLTCRLDHHETDDLLGDQAWVVCPAGHVGRHPLVYPAMVKVLIGAQGATATATAGLRELHWYPHDVVMREPPLDGPVEFPATLDYRQWTVDEAWDRISEVIGRQRPLMVDFEGRQVPLDIEGLGG